MQKMQETNKVISELHNQQHTVDDFHNISGITLQYIYDTMNKVSDTDNVSLRIKLSNDWWDTEKPYHFSSYYHRDYVHGNITITDSRNTYFPSFNSNDINRLYDILEYELLLNGYTVTKLDCKVTNDKTIKTFFIYWGDVELYVLPISWYIKLKNKIFQIF
jgi:hypothetical protein